LTKEHLMYSIYDEFARERVREAHAVAARERLANRAYSARRWQRLAEWSAHRSARASRALSDYVD
jgi:hypothetical protein